MINNTITQLSDRSITQLSDRLASTRNLFRSRPQSRLSFQKTLLLHCFLCRTEGFRTTCSLIALVFCLGCTAETESQSDSLSVFVTRDNSEIYLLPEQPAPARHPNTGSATLMPGLFCERCQNWQAAPPQELWNKMPNGIRCKKCKHPLKPEGPLPEASRPIPSSK